MGNSDYNYFTQAYIWVGSTLGFEMKSQFQKNLETETGMFTRAIDDISEGQFATSNVGFFLLKGLVYANGLWTLGRSMYSWCTHGDDNTRYRGPSGWLRWAAHKTGWLCAGVLVYNVADWSFGLGNLLHWSSWT